MINLKLLLEKILGDKDVERKHCYSGIDTGQLDD